MMNEAKYREAEAAFWGTAGLKPTERRVKLASTGTEVRIQEVGEGEPVLFVHGGPNSGSTWVPILEHFRGFRSILVDRPGTGLSEPYPVTEHTLPEFGARFVGSVLSALDIDSAHVVASSFGGHLSLRSAAAEPERFRRMVQMACPALSPGESIPPFMKFITNGFVRKLLGVLPPNPRANRSIFRQMGHGYSLDHGLVAPEFMDWYLALQKYTDTMKNDGRLIARVVPNRATLELPDELFAAVSTPTLFIWGADDGFGGESVGRHITSTMQNAELLMVPNSGHIPWVDIPERSAKLTAAFLNEQPIEGI